MNIPNFLTLMRICLVPIVVFMIGQGSWMLAFTLFLIAGFTDAVDGFIARKFDMRTDLGAMLDPLADKALLISIYVTLSILGIIPAFLAILVVARDVMIMGAVVVSWLLANPVEIKPLIISKLNTFAQIGFAAYSLARLAFAWNHSSYDYTLPYIVASLTALSLVGYFMVWFRHMADDHDG